MVNDDNNGTLVVKQRKGCTWVVGTTTNDATRITNAIKDSTNTLYLLPILVLKVLRRWYRLLRVRIDIIVL